MLLPWVLVACGSADVGFGSTAAVVAEAGIDGRVTVGAGGSGAAGRTGAGGAGAAVTGDAAADTERYCIEMADRIRMDPFFPYRKCNDRADCECN